MKPHLLCTGLLSLKIMGTYVAILYRNNRSFHNLKKIDHFYFLNSTATSNRTFFSKKFLQTSILRHLHFGIWQKIYRFHEKGTFVLKGSTKKARRVESDAFFPHFSICNGTDGGAFWSLLSPIVFIGTDFEQVLNSNSVCCRRSLARYQLSHPSSSVFI
jgi:hypothetical protein